MGEALPPAGGLVGARVMAGGVEGEERGGAGVPVLLTDCANAGALVLDIKAVAGGAGKGAGAAGDAVTGGLLPERIVKPDKEGLPDPDGVETNGNRMPGLFAAGLESGGVRRGSS